MVKHLVAGGFAADLWLGRELMDVNAYTAAMEALARVQMVPAVDIKAVASRLRQSGQRRGPGPGHRVARRGPARGSSSPGGPSTG